MPGLVGFTDNQDRFSKETLLNMRSLLKHFDCYVSDDLYCEKPVYASRTHLGVIDQGSQPHAVNGNVLSWLEGEFYNRRELEIKYSVASENDIELFANIFQATGSFEFLKDIDGQFAAVLYDKKERKIHLISDRYGFKPLYWGLISDNLVWSSELKGFLGHTDFSPVIDRTAVEEFFDFGYQLENRTWFEGIEMLPPSCVLSFDTHRLRVKATRYWSWSSIEQINGQIDEKEIEEELARLFVQSMQRRTNEDEKIGVSLSGGLDSRAVLAATPNTVKNCHAFTFGLKGCDDMEIGREASQIRGAKHHELILDSDGWLPPRISGTWKSDAAISLLHLHGVEFLSETKLYVDYSLNGFLGDLVLGGSYLKPHWLDKKIDSKIVSETTRCKINISVFDDWYLINKSDPYFINNRGRRFTNAGTTLAATLVEQRKPFLDTDLMDLAYAIPDKLRLGSQIYKKMLLGAFPQYFETIPWQKTGVPISYSRQVVELLKFKRKVVSRLKSEFQRLGYKFDNLSGYTNYAEWIRKEPGKSFCEKMLFANDAIYPAYVNREKIQHSFTDHIENKADYHNEVCAALTFEIWLQQVFAGNCRK